MKVLDKVLKWFDFAFIVFLIIAGGCELFYGSEIKAGIYLILAFLFLKSMQLDRIEEKLKEFEIEEIEIKE